MKKFVVVSALVLVGAAVAFAGTIQVPFFFDNGGSTTSGYPSTGSATWIGLKNPSTTSSLTITIRYFDGTGTERTPTANTYTIAAGAAVSWRPVATDAAEGAGASVPNKNGGNAGGSAVVTYAGSTQVTGRVLQCNGDMDTSDSYLIISE